MNNKKYGIDFGAHGSPRKLPKDYLLTLKEAELQASEWILISSTIGGTADIYEEVINKEVPNKNLPVHF